MGSAFHASNVQGWASWVRSGTSRLAAEGSAVEAWNTAKDSNRSSLSECMVCKGNRREVCSLRANDTGSLLPWLSSEP